MLVLGIVGSPRREGRTASLVNAALQGAASTGADTERIYLVDYQIRPFVGQGGAEEGVRFVPSELSALCTTADALVLGAPVYFGEINGLTKDFMDSVRIPNENGKPALGIAIAGGSGKGLYSGVQSLYHWFYHRQMRAIDPTPATRFVMNATLAELYHSGERLAQMASQLRPFAGAGREDRWAELAAYYADLPYLRCDMVDEFMTLAHQLVHTRRDHPNWEQAMDALRLAHESMMRGERAAAARQAVQAYDLLLQA
ncbi:MAG: flavodoxin family protein [Anaerolineae bacterium]|jgi:multimeric flavodoxin WrbA|nr:flavodoxin family protein [Chloroflexota bacterium]